LKKIRECGDLIEVYKILNGREGIQKEEFFKHPLDCNQLQRHTWKVIKPKCNSTVKMFFSNRTTGTACHKMLLMPHPSTTLRIYRTDIGEI